MRYENTFASSVQLSREKDTRASDLWFATKDWLLRHKLGIYLLSDIASLHGTSTLLRCLHTGRERL
jgi:hypothetical protein